MRRIRKSLLRWIPAISWGLVILVLSLIPGGAGGLTLLDIPHFDKAAHFGMYAVWTFLICLALNGYPAVHGRKAALISLVTGISIGVILEFGQYYLARGRSFEPADMVANALGALAGVWVATIYNRRRLR